MDIEEFYEADERRRQSAEIELGTEWHDRNGVRYELSWVEDTGELYVMREPAPHEWGDPFGGIHVKTGRDAPTEGMTAAVVAHVATREDLERVLSGWEEHMDDPASTTWLEDTLRTAGVGIWSRTGT